MNGTTRKPNDGAGAQRIVRRCLVGLAVALLVVGVVSGTLLRHVVQIVPIIAAIALLARRPDWGAFAALPLFVFWILMVLLIWLFILGLSRLASGHYTPTELIMTLVMAGCSMVGAVNAIQVGRPLQPVRRLILIVLFALLQIAAMWVSFRGSIANR